MLVSQTATSLRTPIQIFDSDGSPATGLLHSTSGLLIQYRRPSDTAWQTVTKVAGGTTWVPGGFRDLGGGVYELSWPDAVIVAGESTAIRITYAGGTRHDSIDAVLSSINTDELVAGVKAGFASSQILLTPLANFINNSEIRLRQGDDYLATKGTAWEKTITLSGFDFSAVGVSVRFGAGNTPGEPLITAAATLLNTAVGSCDLRLEFDRDDTKDQAPTEYRWDVEVVDGDGDVRTIDGGMLNLEPSWTTLA
ncbi:MAG: hypothetical protein WBD31_13680 [Rubripirellula sp.]